MLHATPTPVGEGGGAPALTIPDGALRLDAQARRPMRDAEPVAGAHRGVVARAGRAIVWFVDFGPGPRRMQQRADVPRYAAYAQASARRLAAAAWLG
jgi:hypothetical protein